MLGRNHPLSLLDYGPAVNMMESEIARTGFFLIPIQMYL
jgi:hypothetical protein